MTPYTLHANTPPPDNPREHPARLYSGNIQKIIYLKKSFK